MKNQIKKVLSLVLAIVMCMSTLVLGVSAENECLHENSEYAGYQAPTCTEEGGDKYQCQDCGEIYIPYPDAALGHTYFCQYCEEEHTEAERFWWCENDWNYDEASCTATCTVCGDVADVEHVYDPSNPELIGESCGQWFCAHCGEVVNAGTDNEDNLAHNYVFVPEKTVEPNCNDKDKASGYLYFECTECGQVKKLIANGQHTLTRVLAKAPTCTEDGWEEHYVCKTCNKIFEKYTDTSITDAKEYDPKIEKLGHKDADATVEDCVETGHCEVCDTDYTQAAHDLKTIEVEATCQSGAGEKTYCENCDYVVYSNPDEAIAHSFIVDPNGSGNADKKATCDVAGWEGKYVCEYGCGETYGEDKEIPAGCKNVDKYYPATCSTDAYTCKKCTVCGKETDVKAVEGEKADGKTHLMVPVTLPATCTEAGAKGKMCLYCDTKEDWEVIPATGHSYPADPQHYVDATCSSNAVYYYGCTNSGCTSVKTVEVKGFDTSAEGHIKHIFNIANHEEYEAFRTTDEFKSYRATNGKMIAVPTCTQTGLWMIACSCGANFFDVGDDYYHGDFATQTSYVIENAILKSEYMTLDCLTGTTATMGDWCVECEAFVSGTEVEVTHAILAERLAAAFDPFSFTVIDDKTFAEVTLDDTVKGLESIRFATEAAVEHVCNVRKGIFVDGYAEFDYCVTCRDHYANNVEGKGDVRNLYYDALKAANADKKNHEAVLVEGQEPYCTFNGTTASVKHGWTDYCSVCEKSDADGIKLTAKHSYKSYIIDYTTDLKTPTCTRPGFSADVCENCGFGHVSTGTYYKELGHDFQKTDKKVLPTCDTKGYTVYVCMTVIGTDPATGEPIYCGEEEHRDFVDPLGHINVFKETFTGACTDTETERICTRCGLYVPAECEYDIVVTAPTCLEGGFSVKTCVHCGASEKFGDVEALGHLESKELEDSEKWVKSTYTKEGTKVFYCERCEEEWTETQPVLEGIEMYITADSGIYADANIVNGGLVEFTVALGANMDLNSIVAKFSYDANVLEFVEAKVENILDVKDEAGNTTVITTAASGNTFGLNTGCVTVFVDAMQNSANGAPVDVALVGNEIKFVTLTFRVAADAAYEGTELSGIISEVVSVEDGQIADVYGNLVFDIKDAWESYEELQNEYMEELWALREAMWACEDLEAAEDAGYVATPSEWKELLDAVDAAKADLADYFEEVEKIIAYTEKAIGDLYGTDIIEFEDEEMFRDIVSKLYKEVDWMIDTFGATEYVSIYKLGDVNWIANWDGRINSADALAIRQLMFTKVDGKIEDAEFSFTGFDEEGKEVEVELNYVAEADIDMDGEITLADYALLSQYLVGTITYEDLVLTSQNVAE